MRVRRARMHIHSDRDYRQLRITMSIKLNFIPKKTAYHGLQRGTIVSPASWLNSWLRRLCLSPSPTTRLYCTGLRPPASRAPPTPVSRLSPGSNRLKNSPTGDLDADVGNLPFHTTQIFICRQRAPHSRYQAIRRKNHSALIGIEPFSTHELSSGQQHQHHPWLSPLALNPWPSTRLATFGWKIDSRLVLDYRPTSVNQDSESLSIAERHSQVP